MLGSMKPGDNFVSEKFGVLAVQGRLGEGAQGEVFAVTTAESDDKAVKWAFASGDAASEADRLVEVIKLDPTKADPNLADFEMLVWPEDLVLGSDPPATGRVGYVMQLVTSDFTPLPQLLRGEYKISTERLIRSCVNLTRTFHAVQATGLVYRDIKDENVFLRNADGQIRVVDNDNCVPPDTPCSIIGTTDFMAPEIIRLESNPTRDSDLHSLAVLLFYMLMRGHPLEGRHERKIRAFTLEYQQRLYGQEPLFVFDESDNGNGLDLDEPNHQQVQCNWDFMPRAVRDLFTRAFTVGLKKPSSRPTLREWQGALSTARDNIFHCSSCKKVNFWDPVSPSPCWNCGSELRPSAAISLADRALPLERGSKIFAHHLPDRSHIDFNSAVLDIVANPKRPDILGIQNTSDNSIQVKLPNEQETKQLEPGALVKLQDGLQLFLANQWCPVQM